MSASQRLKHQTHHCRGAKAIRGHCNPMRLRHLRDRWETRCGRVMEKSWVNLETVQKKREDIPTERVLFPRVFPPRVFPRPRRSVWNFVVVRDPCVFFSSSE